MRRVTDALDRFPRYRIGHLPTPVEAMPRLGATYGLDLWVKRDDCTGFAFGGNKVRQLEFYIGEAVAQKADTVLITSAVQSNFMRTAAAMARHAGMQPVLQVEDRVPDVTPVYKTNGNMLLDQILGAEFQSYPDGEDEAGADAAVLVTAERLRAEGRRPYVIPLAANHPPTGALGYVDAAVEFVGQETDVDVIFVGSGSALTHAGLIVGLRALGQKTRIVGVCVRRDAVGQAARVLARAKTLEVMLGLPSSVTPDDIETDDSVLAPGYGQLNPAAHDAIRDAARLEGLFLDPVYTCKVMAGLSRRAETLAGKRVLFWHTGGQPALFAYQDQLTEA